MDQLKIGLRSLLKQRFYSFLNILGFSLGITVFAFVCIFVLDQHLYDRWNPNRENIYRLETGNWALTATMTGPFLKDQVPEIEDFLRVDIRIGRNMDLLYKDQVFTMPNMIMADSTFFAFFPLQFIAGIPENALTENRSLVLTRSQAESIFGRIDVVGETVMIRNKYSMQVTGVVENVKYSHLPVSAIIPFPFLAELAGDPNILNEFEGWNYFTYFSLNPGAEVSVVEEKINKVIYDYYFELFGEAMDRSYRLFPFSKIYFSDHIVHEFPIKHGNRKTVNAFAILAIFVLFIAIINFVNMATARAGGRSKEVGVRKLLGGSRKQLVMQFLTESVITSGLAIFLALALIEFLLPAFNSLAGTSFHFSDLGFFIFLGLLLVLTLAVGFLSGIYPAFYLTAFQPISALKGERTRGKQGAFFRKVLIIFQFVVSISLIASTIIVFRQINFMKNKPLGFQSENVVYFSLDSGLSSRKDALENALREQPEVIDVSFSSSVFGSITWQESVTVNGLSKQYTYFPVHADFLKMIGIEPIAGRHFDPSLRSEEGQVIIINETAINYFELPQEPADVIGEELGGMRIVGVVPDFHFNSLHQRIGPLVIIWREDRSFQVIVRTTGKDAQRVMSHLEQVRNEFMPGRSFNANTIADNLHTTYRQEERFGKIILLFSGFAIIIACLGLFGLASFMAEQRSREIALRKVMGAGQMQISFLMIRDFMVLVVVAFIFSVPFVWFFMEKWLTSFAYHISPGIMPLIFGGVIAILITGITVGYHTLKVSAANPANALKYE
jgi:putative ABC transport system permease protein